MFLELSRKAQAETYQFELTLEDMELHRRRIEERQSDIAGFRVPSWQDVLEREYEEWDEAIDGPRACSSGRTMGNGLFGSALMSYRTLRFSPFPYLSG